MSTPDIVLLHLRAILNGVGTAIRRICLFLPLACAIAAEPVTIEVRRGTPSEEQTREQLQRVLAKYDVSRWLFTRKFMISARAIPHSHPILTLSTRHLESDVRLLSTLLHEEFHWFEDAHPAERDAAVAGYRKAFPDLPVSLPDGARGEYSTYLHIGTCYAEYQLLKKIAGAEEARKAMEFWMDDHYMKIYKLVFEREKAVEKIACSNGMCPWRP